MEWQQMVFEALQRIETKLDKKADAETTRADHLALEGRVRQNERDIVKVFTLGSVLSALSGYVGWKF